MRRQYSSAVTESVYLYIESVYYKLKLAICCVSTGKINRNQADDEYPANEESFTCRLFSIQIFIIINEILWKQIDKKKETTIPRFIEKSYIVGDKPGSFYCLIFHE